MERVRAFLPLPKGSASSSPDLETPASSNNSALEAASVKFREYKSSLGSILNAAPDKLAEMRAAVKESPPRARKLSSEDKEPWGTFK
jgi:hypothetical protein